MKIFQYIRQHAFNIYITIVLVGLIITNFMFAGLITEIDGDARLINYLGLVRGTSQRLVKQELYGVRSTEMVQYIDEILLEISTGMGDKDIAYVDDTKFRKQLKILVDKWLDLKMSLNNYRVERHKGKLYISSEYFFGAANDTVFLAEQLSEDNIHAMKRLKVLLLTFVLLTIAALIMYFIKNFKLSGEIQKLDALSRLDKLTGLCNRYAYDNEIKKYSQLRGIKNLCFVSIDLDDLKLFNDNFGHFVGDRLIELFAEALSQEFSSYGFVSRNGGDEFAIIIENCDTDRLKSLINALDNNIAEKNSKEKIIKISYSWGYAIYNESSSQTIYDIIRASDKNMYENKAAKKKMEACSGVL